MFINIEVYFSPAIIIENTNTEGKAEYKMILKLTIMLRLLGYALIMI